AWTALFEQYRAKFPDLAAELRSMLERKLPDGWDRDFPVFPADAKGLATRDSSSKVLNAAAKNIPWLMGGAADLSPSTKTRLAFDGVLEFEAGSYSGRNMHFGIREHAMGAILNGMSLSNIRPYGATFLIFSNYARASIRLGALMELPVIYVFTHDSIGLGEDGPTHQPIEQLAALRAMPGLLMFRPADANEVAETWRVILPLRHEAAAMALTRQAVPTLDRTRFASAAGVARGAYVLADAPNGKPELLLLATGSEVSLAVAAYEQLEKEGIHARVVSMPCWEIFDRQDAAYRDSVLPPEITARIAIEAASTFGWSQYVGREGRIIGMRTYGASAPIKDLLRKFGFTSEAVIAAARELLARVR
ncbi:MAG: transketolase-like TK C-terminal-containing protein, partial [Bryobacteraceae bacterium]